MEVEIHPAPIAFGGTKALNYSFLCHKSEIRSFLMVGGAAARR
jgi:hypothetical protein